MPKNLLWFKCDINFDVRVKELVKTFGGGGGFTFVVLLQTIYGQEGYYLHWNEAMRDEIAHLTGNTEDEVEKIVHNCLDTGLFDMTMYEKYKILTSHGIQFRYYDCSSRRKESMIKSEYLLLGFNEVYRTKTERDEHSKKIEKSLSVSFKREETKLKADEIETERQTVGLSVSETEQLLQLCGGDELLLLCFLKKAATWVRDNNKAFKKPYAEIKKWVHEYSVSFKQNKPDKETSYDLDEWENFARNFDPSLVGTRNASNSKKSE